MNNIEYFLKLLIVVLLMGCQDSENNVAIGIRHNDQDLSCVCSSIYERHSWFKEKLFDPTGNGWIVEEKIYRINGNGMLHATDDESGDFLVGVYVDSQYYPISLDISWDNKEGIHHHRLIRLTEKDYPITSWWRDSETSSFVYLLHLRSHGALKIIKRPPLTADEVECCKSMNMNKQ